MRNELFHHRVPIDEFILIKQAGHLYKSFNIDPYT